MIDRKREKLRDSHDGNRTLARGSRNTRTRRSLAWFVIVAMLGSFGCSTTLAPQPPRTSQPPYRVGAPDQLSISILPDPEVSLTVTVRPDGMISVPLIGEVTADGMTIPQIAADIETRMAKFKRGAQATVMLVAAAHTEISVLGEVVGTTSFPLVGDTRVVEALAQVGGTTTFAWEKRIRVIRSLDGQTEVHEVDLTDIRRGDLTTNILLVPGDIVYVPPTIWARIGYAINSLLFPFQPIIGLARVGATSLVP